MQTERGFDYALTMHQLKVRHRMRKLGRLPFPQEEPGEKCTLCLRREALSGRYAPKAGVPESEVQGRRAGVREFWKNPELDPDGTGSERLCAVCAFKRYVVAASCDDPPALVRRNSLLDVCLGPVSTDVQRAFVDESAGKAKARLPFPSTAALATQEYLEQLAERADVLASEIAGFVRAYGATRKPRTCFPRSLLRLAALERRYPSNSIIAELLQIEPSYLFPQTIDVEIRKAEQDKDERSKNLEALKRASLALRKKADEMVGTPPSTRIAVLVMDGDRMGDLLLGLPERISASWNAVLHPKAAAWLATHPLAAQAGWPDLLPQTRLTGPSLQAFISRALAEFAHRLVPWVVEREFGGRLIYVGGDDLLAVAPAADALGIAARLQQLFSASWIGDSDHRQDAWDWRKGEATFDPAQARRRFRVVEAGGHDAVDLSRAMVATNVIEGDRATREADLTDCRIYPGLGARQSLSAGLVFAHYKTPLGALLKQARELRDRAKEVSDRSRLAIAHRSRGGAKSETILRWADRPLQTIRSVIEAFRDKRLPGRLPYKLRSFYVDATTAADGDDANRLRQGLLERAVEGLGREDPLHDHLLKLWSNDLDHAVSDPSGSLPPDDRSVSALILCRYLAATGDTGEEDL